MRLAGLLPERKTPPVRWRNEINSLIDELETPSMRKTAYEVLKSLVVAERAEHGYTPGAPGNSGDHE